MHLTDALDIAPVPTLTLRGLISLRWFSILSMTVAATAGQQLSGGTLFIAPLIAVAAVMLSVNTCLTLALLLDPRGAPRTVFFAPLVQLGFDLIGWGAYVYYSGGTSNPLIAVLLPLAAFGAIVLPPVQARIFGAAAVLTYSFLWCCHVPLEPIDPALAGHWRQFGMWTVFAASTAAIIWFVSRMMLALRQRNAALNEAREERTRNRWLVFLGSLAAGTAHQMSTPLATLQILVDDLLATRAADPALRADLELMRDQIVRCKTSLGELTARAGSPRQDTPLLSLEAWLRGLMEGWQSTVPTGSVSLATIPEAILGRRVRPDSRLDSVLQDMLHVMGKGAGTRLTVDALVLDDALTLQIRGGGNAPSGSDDDFSLEDASALADLGGRLRRHTGHDGETVVVLELPPVLFHELSAAIS